MQKVIKGTKDRKKQQAKVVIQKTGHPAAYRKMRCTRCKLGMAVADPNDSSVYRCDRCGAAVKVRSM